MLLTDFRLLTKMLRHQSFRGWELSFFSLKKLCEPMYDNSLCNSSRRTEFVEMYLEIVIKGIQISFFLAELFDKKGLLEECIRRIMELNWTETLWTDISFYESKRFFE